ncbi:MAG: hypothetical protein LBP64_04650 [Tannerella sp.]|jgi:hypothetical protein|nr:hypothetical protein [Tannerella sp.]
MMIHRRFFYRLLLLSCTVATVVATAQDARSDGARKNAISVQPLYIFNRGMRIDYERELHNPYHLLQVSAKGYLMHDGYGTVTTLLFNDDRIEKLSGVGAEVNYKYFFLKRRIPYVSAGVSYGYFRTQQYDSDFAGFREDGLMFYRPDYSLRTQTFSRAGFNTCFGVQTSPCKRFFVDGYIGLGFCRSFYDKNRYHPDSDNMNGLTYNGLTATTGLRLGLRF